MKIRGFVIGIVLVLMASSAQAASFSINITSAAQDTYIQANILPIANKNMCAKYGLPATCTGPQLTTAGCVATPFTSVTKRIRVYEYCTPYTLNAAGQALHGADLYARDMIALFESERAQQVANARSNFDGFSAAAQNAICALLDDGPAAVPATVCDIQ